MSDVFVCIVALLFHGLQQIDGTPSKPCILPEPLMVDKWFTTQGRLMSFGRRNFTTIYKTEGHVQVKRSPEAYETYCLSDRKVQLRFKYPEGHFQCLTLTVIRRGLVLVEKIEDRAVVNDVIDCHDNRFSTTRDVEQFVLSRYMPKGVKYGKAKCWTPFTSGSSITAAESFKQSKMKFPDCMRTCVVLGYSVFGFLNGSSCICAHDTKETFEIIAGSSEQAMKMCQVHCRGQHKSVYPTICGGTDHISTYSVMAVENEGNFRYEDDVGGCWADVYVPGRHRQLIATFFMSPALCVRFCSSHGFLYAATSEGRVCTCRNSYGTLGKGRRCTAKCVGGQEAEVHGYCGNVNRPYLNNVYQVMQFSSDTVKRRVKPELRGTWYTSTVPQRIVQVYKQKILITEIQPEEGSVRMKTVIGTDEILDISPRVTRVRYFWVSEGQKYQVCLTFVMSDDNRTVDVTYVEASTDRFNNPCAMRTPNPDLRSYSQFAISRRPLPHELEYTEVGCYFQERSDPVMYEAARHDNTGARLGECARYCYLKHLPYFAIMSRSLCYCGYGDAEEVLDSGCLAGCGMTNFPCNKNFTRNMFTMKMYKIGSKRHRRAARSGGHTESSVRRRNRPAQTDKPVKTVTLTKLGRPNNHAGPGKPVNAIQHIKSTKSSKHARFTRNIVKRQLLGAFQLAPPIRRPIKQRNKKRQKAPKKRRKAAKTYSSKKPNQETPCQAVYDILRKGPFHTSALGDRIVQFLSGYKFKTLIRGSKQTNKEDPIYPGNSAEIVTNDAEQVTCYSDTTLRLLISHNIFASCMTFQIINNDLIEVENIRVAHESSKSQLCSRMNLGSTRYNFVLSGQNVHKMKFDERKCNKATVTETALQRSRKFYMTGMTFPGCIRTCIYLGYAYFGMLNGVICICFHDEAETFGPGGVLPHTFRFVCNVKCQGQYVPGYPPSCGGTHFIESYRILSRSNNHQHAADVQYLGCWADVYDVTRIPIWRARRILPIESCLDFCSNMGTLYAAVSSRKACTCANHFGRLGPGKGCITCSSESIEGESWRCGSDLIPFYHSVYIVTRYPPEAMKKTIPRGFRGFWYTHTFPRRQLIIYGNHIFMRTIPDVSQPGDIFYMTSRNIISPAKYVLLVQDFKERSGDDKAERSCFIMILSKDFSFAEISYRKSIITGGRSRYPCHVSDKNLDRSSFDRYAVRRVPLPKRVGYKDHGCYFYNRNPLFSMAPQNNSTHVDKTGCARFCHTLDYQYFYIMNRTQCYCDDGLSEKVLDVACTAKCGEASDTCSGNKTALKIPVKEYRIDGAYLMIPFTRGCFLLGDSLKIMCRHRWSKRKFPCMVKKESSDAMQPRRCAHLCRPYRHFFIFNITTCYCELRDVRMTRGPNSNCSTPCPGDVRALCGEPKYMSGYDNHGDRQEAKIYARTSPPALPLTMMKNKEAWKKPNDLFKDFFTSVDHISKWKENEQEEVPALVTRSPEVLPVKPKTIQAAVNESHYGKIHRLPCKQIPEQIQNHVWWSSKNTDRKIVFRKLHYETSGFNRTNDPLRSVWRTTPTAYDRRCFTDLKIRLKFKFSWRFSQCMTLTILRPTTVKVQLIHQWYEPDNPLDCTHTNTSRDRKVYEFALTPNFLGVRGPLRHSDQVDGCWVDRYDPERHVTGGVPYPNAESCTLFCSKRGFLYAAGSARKNCTCMNDYGLFGSEENCQTKWPFEDRQLNNFARNAEVPYLYSVYKILDFDDGDLITYQIAGKKGISRQFQGVWFTSTLPRRQIIIYEYQVFTRTLPAVIEPDDMELIEADEILQLSENLLRIRQQWSQDGKDYHACMTIERAKHGNTAFVTYVLANTNRTTNPCFMREKGKILLDFSQFVMSRRPVPEDVGYKFEACYYMDVADPIMFSAVMYDHEAVDKSECARFCYVKGLPYAAIMLTTHCYCGYGALEKVKDRRCLVRCGLRTTSCHHKSLQTKRTMQLFRVGGVSMPSPTSVGCYQLTTLLRHQCGINTLQQSTDCYMMTMYNDFTNPTTCAQICPGDIGFIYILNKFDCYCSLKEFHIVKVGEEKCDYMCADAKDLRCGGFNYISVYSNWVPATPPAWKNVGPSTPPLPFTDMRKHMSSTSRDGKFSEYFKKLDEIIESRKRDPVNLPLGQEAADDKKTRSGRDSDTALPVTDMRKHMTSASRGGKFSVYSGKHDEIKESHKRNPVNLPLRQEAADDKITGSGRDSNTVPEVTGDSGEVLVRAGRGARLSCYDNDAPPPSGNLTFTWIKGDIPVTDSRFTMTPDGELMLRHAEIGDSAEYSCQFKGQDDDDNPVNDKVNKTLIVFLLPDTRYLVRLKYHVRQCDGHLAGKKIDHAREYLCTSTPCPFVNFQAHCHSNLNDAGMRKELWLSLTIEPSSDFVEPKCEPECMEKATVKHLQQELHLVKQFIRIEKNNVEGGTQDKLSAPTILADETVKQLLQGCPAGFIPAHKVCTPCHPGTYAKEKSRECHPCKEGYYQPYYGTYKCYKCPGGSSKGQKGATSKDTCQNVGGVNAIIGLIGGSSVAALMAVIAASVIVYRYTSLCRKPRSKNEEGGGYGDLGTDDEEPISVEGVTSDCGDVPLLVPKVSSRLTAQPYARSSSSADSIDVDSPWQHPALVTATSSRVRSRSYSHGSVHLSDTYGSRGSGLATDQRHLSTFGSRQMVKQSRSAGSPNYSPTPGMSPHSSYQSQLHDIRYAGSSCNDYGMYSDVQLVVPDVPSRHSHFNTNENYAGELEPPNQSPVYAPGHGRSYSQETQIHPAGSVHNTGAHGPSQYDDYYHPSNQTL